MLKYYLYRRHGILLPPPTGRPPFSNSTEPRPFLACNFSIVPSRPTVAVSPLPLRCVLCFPRRPMPGRRFRLPSAPFGRSPPLPPPVAPVPMRLFVEILSLPRLQWRPNTGCFIQNKEQRTENREQRTERKVVYEYDAHRGPQLF